METPRNYKPSTPTIENPHARPDQAEVCARSVAISTGAAMNCADPRGRPDVRFRPTDAGRAPKGGPDGSDANKVAPSQISVSRFLGADIAGEIE